MSDGLVAALLGLAMLTSFEHHKEKGKRVWAFAHFVFAIGCISFAISYFLGVIR